MFNSFGIWPRVNGEKITISLLRQTFKFQTSNAWEYRQPTQPQFHTTQSTLRPLPTILHLTSFYERMSEIKEQFMGYLQCVFLLQQTAPHIYTLIALTLWKVHWAWECTCIEHILNCGSNCVWQENIGTVWVIIDISTEIKIRVLLSIKLGTVMSECDRAAKQMTNDTKHKFHTTHFLQLCCIIGFA